MHVPPAGTGRLLAGPHNARLGPAIHAFNLPATPDVCVGATPACSAACSAKGFPGIDPASPAFETGR